MHLPGGERAAGKAAAASRSDEPQEARRRLCFGVFMSSLTALVVWGVFFLPSDGEKDTCIHLAGLSFFIWFILYIWAFVVNLRFLHEALVSSGFMIRVLHYYVASMFPSLLCAMVSLWLCVYYFGLEMMAMAAFFGYTLAVNARCKEIMARDLLVKDLELGDVVQELA